MIKNQMVASQPPTSRAGRGATALPRPFEDFFEQTWPWAFRLATFLVHDPTDGEEIAQNVLSDLYRTWGTAANPEAYLRTSIVNACSNWHRHDQVRRNKLPLLAQSGTSELDFDSLSDAVAKLPFRQRAVIVLRFHLGLSEAEIADAIGCRPGTVKSLCSRALRQLSKEIKR